MQRVYKTDKKYTIHAITQACITFSRNIFKKKTSFRMEKISPILSVIYMHGNMHKKGENPRKIIILHN